ncbi:VCBS domain-containing protein [Bradyrhizobium sp. JYMT SZCCT0180]|uniref:VCBS domain-containing protein n=1 Tax=Bradyrhizobium sp. JYMT SZCCT0180 TaxID=2807666 RepID=UPI002010DC14|nr:VCBS domain-containing protein [Bradyrhizobium sp. JYMT SZCCT0180]
MAGKFTDVLPGGHGAHLGGHVHTDSVSTHAPSGAIIVPDAHLLFTGDFKRTGVDLVLSGDGRELVLHDYFKGEKRAALASPDGAHLTGNLVNALTGHTQLAQADGSPSMAQVIGHVTKLVGTATAIRNGVSIILNNGDNVNKGDVVQSGSDSTLGITFIDGSVFGLASNARMVLNEMIYDPNGSNNSSLISLVQGTISFVAGATAKKGDMKVDTPVATMGIRGTAVLVEIDFAVPGQGGAPPAKFQVLVEPDGTTGSYILFDKTTMTPIATVNQAGTQTIVSGQGTVNFLSSVQLSPDAQKIISDVFQLKFTDLNNPQQLHRFTDSPVPENMFIRLAGGETVPVKVTVTPFVDTPLPTNTGTAAKATDHIPGPPDVVTSNAAFTERAGLTGSAAQDTLTGEIAYSDLNPGDVPTAQASFASFKYENAQHSDVTASLTAEQVAAIKAVEVPLAVVQDPNQKNRGTATWTYSVPDGAFDFLAAGETLTLTYIARVDNNFAANNEITFKTFTITITGTNDKPTVATSGGTVIERDGTGNNTIDTISGTVTFTDTDLTDRPVVSAAISTTEPFRYLDAQGHNVTATLTQAQLDAIATVKVPLNVVQGGGNGHNGSATWTYSIADHAFDFIAKGETLILNYVIKVDDGHGGVVFTPVSISINGADVTVIGTNDVPTITTTDDAFAELSNPNPAQPNPTGSPTLDTASGTITFTDVDLTDRPVASAAYTSYVYTGASDDELTLTAQQLADVAVALGVTQTPGNTHNGSASWSYSVADGKFDFLAVGEVLTLTYTATIDDGRGGVITKPINITVTGTNDTPAITGGSLVGTITEAADTHDPPTPDPVEGTILFADVDQSDTHDVTITGVSASGVTTGLAGYSFQFGWLTLDTLVDSTGGVTGTQDWKFSASDQYFDYLAEGEWVSLAYTVEIDDHHGGITTQEVVITVHGSNDAPEVAADVSGDAGTALHAIAEEVEEAGVPGEPTVHTATGSLAFRDVDLSDTHSAVSSKPAFAWHDSSGHTLSLSGNLEGMLTAASALTLTLPLNDSVGTGLGSVDFSYSAVDSVFDFLAHGETLTVTYDITVSDEHDVASTQPITFTVTGANDAPVAVADTDIGHIVEAGTNSDNSVLAGVSTTSGDVLANDTDVDLSDTHHVIGVVAGSMGGVLTNDDVGTIVAGTYGSLVLNANGSWTYTLDNTNPLTNALAQDVHASDIFSYTESDGHGGTSTTTLTIDVTGTNDAPVVVAALTDSVNEGVTAFTRNLLNGASDVDHGETATLYVAGVTYAVNGGAASGTAPAGVSLGADGHTLTVDPADPAFDHLAVGEHATIVVSYNVTDAQGATVAQTETITINGTNDAPVISIEQVAATSNGDGTTTISGLSVIDPDAATLTLTTTTAGSGSGTSAAPVSDSGTLAHVNETLLSGIAYNEGSTPTSTDMVTLTVTDAFSASDTVNFIFNVAANPVTPVMLAGTANKDVFFGTENVDQFVFAANSNHDTIMNFTSGQDKIDLSAIVTTDDPEGWFNQHVVDMVVTIDAADTIILRGPATLTHNDFILHPGGGVGI